MAISELTRDSNDTTADDVSSVDHFQYRPLSTAALASVVFGVVSSLTFLAGNNSLQACFMLCPIPIVGLVCGFTALKKMRQAPDQFSGWQAAVAGTVMSTLGLVGGLSYASYIHATEVPSGYQRLSFSNLRPDDVEKRANEPIPRDVVGLDEQPIFIKGYMRPGSHVSKNGTPVRNHVSQFLLVRDSAECCFGDISTVKFYDKMQVQLVDPLQTAYAGGLFRVAGRLSILPANPRKGRREPVYQLQADYIQ